MGHGQIGDDERRYPTQTPLCPSNRQGGSLRPCFLPARSAAAQSHALSIWVPCSDWMAPCSFWLAPLSSCMPCPYVSTPRRACKAGGRQVAGVGQHEEEERRIGSSSSS